jgi:hypothetical protein
MAQAVSKIHPDLNQVRHSRNFRIGISDDPAIAEERRPEIFNFVVGDAVQKFIKITCKSYRLSSAHFHLGRRFALLRAALVALRLTCFFAGRSSLSMARIVAVAVFGRARRRLRRVSLREALLSRSFTACSATPLTKSPSVLMVCPCYLTLWKNSYDKSRQESADPVSE